jgi:predicted permease
MFWLRLIYTRLYGLLRKNRIEQEMEDEMRFHLLMRTRENIERGMRPDEAEREARRRFGNVGRIKDLARDIKGGGFIETLLQDLRFGARMLMKNPGFTLIAVITLALGIGANTALFSVVDAVLLRTLPVAEPEQLVLFEWQAGPTFRTNGMSGTSSIRALFRYDIFEKMRRMRAAAPDSPLSDFFAFAPIYEGIAVAHDQPEIVNGQAVLGGYYAGLGVQPILGRAITDEDDKAGAAPVVVLSYQFWQERFGANPAVIGQPLKLNKESFTIIGVTPPEFTGALQVGYYPAVTVPIACEPLLRGARSKLDTSDGPGPWWLHLMGRLKPGATYEQARESLNSAFQATALEAMPPPRNEKEPARLDPKDYPRLVAQSGSRGMLDNRKHYEPTIYGLFIVVALVLLIACANVANLLLARASLRGPEISVRLAVGAGRWRLVRQLLTESVLLAALGGAVGLLFAFWGKSALMALTDKDTGILPNNIDLSLNWRVLAFTLAISILTGALFGLAPAWRATSLDLATSLKQSRRTTGAVSRLSKGLIVAQVALSLLMSVGAGLFIRTLYNLQLVNLGFNQENLLLFQLQPGQSGYKGEGLLQFYQRLFDRLDNLPGVRAATFQRTALIANDNSENIFLLPGETEMTAGWRGANTQTARENYFATMEIPLLRGRGFTAQDDQRAPNVAIINQTFARKYFPNDDALGKRVIFSDRKREIEIIGIVADTKYTRQREEDKPLFYTPWRQESAIIGRMHFAVRTTGEPTALAATVRQVVRELDSNLPVTEVTTQMARSQATLGDELLSARLLSFFGGLALTLTAIGLAGVLAWSVSQRTNEIGIRMALGAQVTDVLRLVVWQGMKLVLLGLGVGAAGGYVLKRMLASKSFAPASWEAQMVNQLYGVTLTDPMTSIVIALLLILVGLLACWIPARWATKVDPMVALRAE